MEGGLRTDRERRREGERVREKDAAQLYYMDVDLKYAPK